MKYAMKTIGEIRRLRLMELRDAYGSTWAALNRRTDKVSRDATYSQIWHRSPDSKTGKLRNMGSALARSLEVACNKPHGWMDTDPGTDGALANGSNFTRADPVVQEVPLISWVQAGSFREIEDQFQPGEADEWVPISGKRYSNQAFALRVQGDSMVSADPKQSFWPGTTIVVDPNRSPNAGDYVIAKDVETQEATFKRLATDGGRWYLQPLNGGYPTVEIDDPALRVIGVVVRKILEQEF